MQWAWASVGRDAEETRDWLGNFLSHDHRRRQGRQQRELARGEYNIPKPDLVAAVQLALENQELQIARGLRDAAALAEELVSVRKSYQVSGRKDWARIDEAA